MRKIVRSLLSLSLASGVGISLSPAAAAAPAPSAPAVTGEPGPADDELISPLEKKRRALREKAVSDVLSGRATPEKRNGSTVVKVGQASGGGAFGGEAGNRRGASADRDQYVELAREKTDRIFVILAEFGDERDPRFPDRDTNPSKPGPQRFDGPVRNQIPAPDRSVDNKTVWQADYGRQHYQDLYFGEGRDVESVKTYYETQSSGRYSVDGTVTDWVKVRYNEARYGRSGDNPNDANGDDPNVCAGNVCNTTFDLVRDAANQWVADQEARGRTRAEIVAELKTFDQWDRYDFDADGNFNEPDGYLDHFQIVHAGGDEADGDPWQAEDAIWSHRAFAYQDDEGDRGPSGNLLGGTEIADTGLWIGDYTMQPENGGLSVFAHEYGHDLGLPDDYNVLTGGTNNNEHWTLMAQSRLNAAGEPLGTRPGDLGAWNKLQLGWLDYETVVAKQKRTLTLGPEEYNTDQAQAAVVVLPKKRVTTEFGAPYAGSRQYFSGNADDLRNSMTRQFDLTGATDPTLTFKARYDIEEGFDYLYVRASLDGQRWTALDGTVDGEPFIRDGANTPRPALGGSTDGRWADVSVPLDAYAGQNVYLQFYYRTDGGYAAGGFFADNIQVVDGGTVLFSDDAESASPWTLRGFTTVGTSSTGDYDNFYIAGRRTHISYDRYLRTGPYNFGFANTKPNWVEHYAYQQGLLISYWDRSQVDNDTNTHPGQGRNLYIDAHPRPMYRLDGLPWSSRIQVYDAPFGLRKADSFTLHVNGRPSYIRGQAAQPLFDDTKQYFYAELPNHGVKLPATGVKIRVVEENGASAEIRIS
ncbi:immune inhibitor A domain-containing protein [Actinoplanes sp. NBRC 103695]|uniref:immune inhibitor A domain-containing protein n=1 Tax=Actinoplanes sp. NBRC 103695 TaxID=3032202 RepID=UPI0024A23F7C|nr:immune inhibitor A domain-containing protein [Actinoplanes sp. NBRC 103695]GLY93796.1 protease [Actinoplanes sp. NBRC 103695]